MSVCVDRECHLAELHVPELLRIVLVFLTEKDEHYAKLKHERKMVVEEQGRQRKKDGRRRARQAGKQGTKAGKQVHNSNVTVAFYRVRVDSSSSTSSSQGYCLK